MWVERGVQAGKRILGYATGTQITILNLGYVCVTWQGVTLA